MLATLLDVALPLVALVTAVHGPGWLAALLGAALLAIAAAMCFALWAAWSGRLAGLVPPQPPRRGVAAALLACDLLVFVLLLGLVAARPDAAARALVPAGLLAINLAQFAAQWRGVR